MFICDLSHGTDPGQSYCTLSRTVFLSTVNTDYHILYSEGPEICQNKYSSRHHLSGYSYVHMKLLKRSLWVVSASSQEQS